jgi:hypothetical protein
MILTLLIVLLLLGLVGGPYIARNPIYARWSPAAVVLVVLLVLLLTGELGNLPRLGHCRC